MKIEDGKGQNGPASVNTNRRLNTSASISPKTFYVSRDSGLAYHAIMPSFNAAAGNYIFYIKNASATRNMFIEDFKLGSVQGVLYKLWEVSGTAAAGTTIVPKNLNLAASLNPEIICMGGGATITGLTLGDQISTRRSAGTIGGQADISFQGALILPPGKAIMVEYDTGTTGLTEVECHFWLEDINGNN